MDIVFNDESITCQFCTKYEANSAMVNLIACFSLLEKEMTDSRLIVNNNPYLKELAKGYYIYNWINDSTFNMEHHRKFRSMLNRQKKIDDSLLIDSYFLLNSGETSITCLTAYEFDSLLISCPGENDWEVVNITGKYFSLNHEMQDEVDGTIINVYSTDTALEVIPSLNAKELNAITTFAELWERRFSLFPHLIFCLEVQAMLESINRLYLKKVFQLLKCLDSYFEKSQSRFHINDVGHGASGESESVMNSRHLQDQRKFTHPDGTIIQFNYHLRIFCGYSGRLYFAPDCDNACGIIGYIGKHLPTALYSTI